MVPPEEILARTSRLSRTLASMGVDGALMIYPTDLLYYSGTRQNGLLWIPSAGNPTLLIRKSLSRAKTEAGIPDVRPFPPSRELPSFFGDHVKTIGITFDAVPVQTFTFYRNLLPGRQWVDISAANREIRSVKSAWELAQLKESGSRIARVFGQVPEFLSEGMREIDASIEFEYRLRKSGHQGFVRMRSFALEVFMGAVISASGSTFPGYFDGPVTGRGLSAHYPQGASEDPVAPNSPVMIDYAFVYNGYTVDMTRMFCIGRLHADLEKAFATSIAIQEEIARRLRPGEICENLYLEALAIAERAGLSECFMGMPGENAKFVGHGVGIELDELPVLAKGFRAPLGERQVVAVEPKFVLPGLGAIGIENTYIVTADGGEKITVLDDDIVFL